MQRVDIYHILTYNLEKINFVETTVEQNWECNNLLCQTTCISGQVNIPTIPQSILTLTHIDHRFAALHNRLSTLIHEVHLVNQPEIIQRGIHLPTISHNKPLFRPEARFFEFNPPSYAEDNLDKLYTQLRTYEQLTKDNEQIHDNTLTVLVEDLVQKVIILCANSEYETDIILKKLSEYGSYNAILTCINTHLDEIKYSIRLLHTDTTYYFKDEYL